MNGGGLGGGEHGIAPNRTSGDEVSLHSIIPMSWTPLVLFFIILSPFIPYYVSFSHFSTTEEAESRGGNAGEDRGRAEGWKHGREEESVVFGQDFQDEQDCERREKGNFKGK